MESDASEGARGGSTARPRAPAPRMRRMSTGARCGGGERGMTRGAGARLDVPAARDLHHAAREGDAERRGERLCAVELDRRLLTQPVIDAVRVERQVERGRESREHVEQRHRVRAAAHRDEEPRAALELRFAGERSPREGEDRRRRRPHFVLPRANPSAATVSTWLVCGNISNASIAWSVYPASASVPRSRPSVTGSHET